MLSKIRDFVKNRFSDIILFIVVALLVLLSFACGFIIAKYQDKEPIQIKSRDTNILMHTNDTNDKRTEKK